MKSKRYNFKRQCETPKRLKKLQAIYDIRDIWTSLMHENKTAHLAVERHAIPIPYKRY